MPSYRYTPEQKVKIVEIGKSVSEKSTWAAAAKAAKSAGFKGSGQALSKMVSGFSSIDRKQAKLLHKGLNDRAKAVKRGRPKGSKNKALSAFTGLSPVVKLVSEKQQIQAAIVSLETKRAVIEAQIDQLQKVCDTLA